jgi:hypothetical protein
MNTRYCVVIESVAKDLLFHRKVEARLAEGWELAAPLVVTTDAWGTGHCFYQSMVRHDQTSAEISAHDELIFLQEEARIMRDLIFKGVDGIVNHRMIDEYGVRIKPLLKRAGV